MVYDMFNLTLLPKIKRQPFDWYVDSVAGSDSNDGKSESNAFQTIAKLQTVLLAGQRVGLRRGSHWREQLNLPGNNCAVGAYGSGNRPILDGSNVIPAGSWVKTTGRTNVFEIPITPEWNGSGKDWVNVWCDDAVLVRVADVATCDSTPGSCLPSAQGAGTVTLYVHPPGSTDPRVDGKTYEYTHRKYGLFCYGYSGAVITGIETRKSLHNDGSLVVGSYTRLNNCLARWGSTHNIYCRTGSILTDCIAQDGYFGGTNFTLYVANENTPNGEGVIFRRCQALQTTYSALAGGFYGHCNTSGSFGIVYFEDCFAQNLNVAFNFGNADEVRCTGAVCNNTTRPFRVYLPWVIDGAVITGTTDRVIEILANTTVLAKNLDIYMTGSNALLFYSTNIVNFTLTDSKVRIYNPSGLCRVVYLENSSSVITLQRNQYYNGFATLYFMSTMPALVSDYNKYESANAPFRWGANNYSTLAAWQSATGKDLNSTIGVES